MTFHVATRFFPKRIRHPTYVMYAFFRIADDVVDDPEPDPPAVQQAELDRIREAALGECETDDPVLAAFAELRQQHEIPKREIEEFIRSMERDIDWDEDEIGPDNERRTDEDERIGIDENEGTGTDENEGVGTDENGGIDHRELKFDGFADEDELTTYLRGSAVAVAYMMLSVMEPDDPDAARPHARALGEAFQLTNFLRDVREDADLYGRIYLPRSLLDQHGVSESEIEHGQCTDAFQTVMETELRRAEARYREGVSGIRLLPTDCQFPVLLAAVYYAEYHRLIRRRDYNVLSSEPELTLSRYLVLVARTWFHWRRTGDPEEVFYRVSAVQRSEPVDLSEPLAPSDPTTSSEPEPTARDRAVSIGRTARRLVARTWSR